MGSFRVPFGLPLRVPFLTAGGEVVSDSEAEEMSQKSEPDNNCDRLLTHLEDGSLAFRLVRAHRDRDIAEPEESMRIVLRERLQRMRGNIDNPED